MDIESFAIEDPILMCFCFFLGGGGGGGYEGREDSNSV